MLRGLQLLKLLLSSQLFAVDFLYLQEPIDPHILLIKKKALAISRTQNFDCCAQFNI